jgi:hypothetical protein
MKKLYKTKKRKEEFRLAYMKIGDINKSIVNREIELNTFIKNEDWDNAIETQKYINNLKIDLLGMGKQGWDINYIAPSVSGYGSYIEYPELD